MRRSLLAVAGLGLASMATASAQPATGLYVAGSSGVAFRETILSASGNTRIGTDAGPTGVASLGWGFGNGIRAEIEGGSRTNDVTFYKARTSGGFLAGLQNPRGNISTSAVMANLAFDADLGSFGLPVRPYVGAGIGYGWLQNGAVGDAPFVVNGPGNQRVVVPGQFVGTGTEGKIAYQVFSGLSWAVPGIDGLNLTAEYRFFGMDHVKFNVNRVLSNTGSGIRTHGWDDYHTHSVLLGLRYSLADILRRF